ncbi:MAG: hypothetical protein IIZ78_20065 [Clostridiales bacterium]|jgi:hypothetical protein|nr:hypothetical protein [Clostridiales bacterium]
MAKFQSELPFELIESFNKLNQNSEKIMGDMTVAGAKVVLDKIKAKCPATIRNHARMSVTYRTPSDGAINTKVYWSGYVPFSDPNRDYFSRAGANGRYYSTTKGVPASFLAILYEYGRSNAPFPKQPSLRQAIGDRSAIEQAMFEAQEKGWEILGISTN